MQFENLQISTTFTIEDLKRGHQLSKCFLKIPVAEKNLSLKESFEKYQDLLRLKEFLESFDQNSLSSGNHDFAVSMHQPPLFISPPSNEEEKEEQKNPVLSLADQEMHPEEEEDPIFKELLTRYKQSPEAYVSLFIDYVLDLFNRERGKDETKKANLSDTKSCQIEPCAILRNQIEAQQDQMVVANVKALIPLQRERLKLEWDEEGKVRYRRNDQQPLREKRIFGIVTPWQLGYIPSLDVFKNEDEENFYKDTYIFRSLLTRLQGAVDFDQENERRRVNIVEDYTQDSIKEDSIQQQVKVGTMRQIQLFHKFIISDLFRQEKPLDFINSKSKDKKYYLVPLILKDTFPFTRYEVDHKLLQKIEQIENVGYHGLSQNIIDRARQKQLSAEGTLAYLSKYILVKSDKPHSCYNFFQLLENLKDMSAEEFAVAIKGKPEDLGCKTAFELVYNVHTRFKSIESFRQSVFSAGLAQAARIKEMPLMLLDPIKVISHLKFKFALEQCPKNPDKKIAYRKQYREKNNLTTSQGKPIFSAFHIYKHYMTREHWNRGSQLPIVLSFFERVLFCHQLIAQIGSYLHPEMVLWATSAQGIAAAKKSYETLETYGDTILKLAATLLAYDRLKDNQKADENTINSFKSAFITNLYLYRTGNRLGLKRYIRAQDPDPKLWTPPYCKQQPHKEHVNCTGKNIADCVESLIGAFFISNNLHRTLAFISDMKLVPLRESGLLEGIPDRDLTFPLEQEDLDRYGFCLSDSVLQLYLKYFHWQQRVTESHEQSRVLSLIQPDKEVDELGSAYHPLFLRQGSDLPDLRALSREDLESALLGVCLAPVQEILGYKFQNPMLLLEALTHSQFQKTFGLEKCYEKLEILGDAVLDYLANSNLMKFTLFEKYNVEERLRREFITQEDFQPFDAHQAKSYLTKNDFLAKLLCLFDLHRYILFQEPPKPSKKQAKGSAEKGQSDSEPDIMKLKEDLGPMSDWKAKKMLKALEVEREAGKYIALSFRRDFSLNMKDIEFIQAPKILGDVFEALLGAIFVDGGMEQVLKVYQHLLAPFVLFVAKFSKVLSKEPKEEFILEANARKIKPEFRIHSDSETVPVGGQEVKLLKVEVLFNGNEVMATGLGNTRKQAERNASIQGLQWIRNQENQEQMDWE